MRTFGMIGLIGVFVGVIAVAQLIGKPLSTTQPTQGPTTMAATPRSIPKLVDLGSKVCIPCKQMIPILDELKKDYAGKFDVEFIDVWVKENAAKARQYGIKAIPTQIFHDPTGKELWRHEGYISKDDILARWKQLGYDFTGQNASQPASAAAGAK